MAPAHEVRQALVVDLDAHRRDKRRRGTAEEATVQDDAPGWLLRPPAYEVVEHLVPWARIVEGGSFAVLLTDPIDAHLIRTRFPSHALARRFCGGPTLEQVAVAVTGEPRRIKARVWVGGYGGPDEGVTVTAVYVRFEGRQAVADARAGRHPALWAWLAARPAPDGGDGGWPEPDEITTDRTDVREPGTWWRLRWGPARTPFTRTARPGPSDPPGGS